MINAAIKFTKANILLHSSQFSSFYKHFKRFNLKERQRSVDLKNQAKVNAGKMSVGLEDLFKPKRFIDE